MKMDGSVYHLVDTQEVIEEMYGLVHSEDDV